jgi:ABC-type Fe3+/spermidine/putrescine transport system ATPase subunit
LLKPAEHALVRLSGVCKAFGEHAAVHPLDLEIHAGDFLAILGPSGCGKTTLLNMIAGFLMPDAGTIEIGGRDVTRLGPERRPTNMVVQGYGLFPHMTTRQNIAYGLRIRRTAAAEVDRRVREVVELVHLEGLENRSVTQLSGGQAQRVALARALIMRPEVLLLDEPLAALDLQLRRTMQEELRRIHHSIGGTFVFVTHDQEEAMRLANRVAVMQGGRLIQEGTAEEIYARPRTRFVSTFIGEANVFRGRREAGRVALDAGIGFPSPGADGRVVSVIRPEVMTVVARPGTVPARCELVLSGRVEDVIFLGAYVTFKVAAGGQNVTAQSADPILRHAFKVGDEVAVAWESANQTVLADE